MKEVSDFDEIRSKSVIYLEMKVSESAHGLEDSEMESICNEAQRFEPKNQ